MSDEEFFSRAFPNMVLPGNAGVEAGISKLGWYASGILSALISHHGTYEEHFPDLAVKYAEKLMEALEKRRTKSGKIR
jgi:hypothetical protein